jgi:hypothetical protein
MTPPLVVLFRDDGLVDAPAQRCRVGRPGILGPRGHFETG